MTRTDANAFPSPTKALGQALDDRDRTVAAPGAADRHREIASVLAPVTGQEKSKEVLEPVEKLPVFRVSFEKIPDLGVASCFLA